jgi:hypothetical protein
MKTTKFLLTLLAIAAPFLVQADTPDPAVRAGVNDVQFAGAPQQRFLGSGFVLEHQGRLFGVTAKHVLLMHKGAPLASTDIQPSLDQWRLRDPRGTGTTDIRFGRLLNGDATEAMTEKVLERDFFLFELADAGGFTPLRLASKEPKVGDLLQAIGCSYSREKTCAQDIYIGSVVGRQGDNLLMDLGSQPLRQLFGLSGSPLLNQAGELVGMVSNILPDASGTMRFAPIDTRQLRELLKTYSKPTH